MATNLSRALAVTDEGYTCRPNDPEASCFCVLGRISKELDVGNYPDFDEEWEKIVSPNYDNSQFYNVNDKLEDAVPRDLACPDNRPGNQAVLDLVEKKLLKPTLWQRIKGFFA